MLDFYYKRSFLRLVKFLFYLLYTEYMRRSITDETDGVIAIHMDGGMYMYNR